MTPASPAATSEQQAIVEAIRSFAEAEIRPHVLAWDEAQQFPRDVFHKLGQLGFLGMIFPEKYGGAALTYMDYAAVIEEVSRALARRGAHTILRLTLDGETLVAEAFRGITTDGVAIPDARVRAPHILSLSFPAGMPEQRWQRSSVIVQTEEEARKAKERSLKRFA